MLLEPGPIALFTDAEIPMPTPRGTFAPFTAREASELVASSALAGQAAGQLAPALGAAGDLRAAADLSAAVSEHDRQSRESDSEIASVAAGAGALESHLAGLTNEVAGELASASMPEEPSAPDEGENEDWKDPEYGAIINEWFNKYLGRDAPDDHIEGLRNARARLVDILAGILGSEEYLERVREGLVLPGGGLPTPRAPGAGAPGGAPGAGGAPGGESNIRSDSLREYVERHPERRDEIEDFLARNPGDDDRAKAALDLPD